MKKFLTFLVVLTCILAIVGCSDNQKEMPNGTAANAALGKLPAAEDCGLIGNQIPQWVSDADWNKPFYVVTSKDLQRFDAYAKENFPSFYDDGWTKEQSDAVYLGQGIEMHHLHLDEGTPTLRVVYYPVILNGVIVSGYEVYEQLEDHTLSWQASPALVNELNVLMDLTSEDTPLILGYNNNNTIGIIGNTYYVLDTDRMEHKEAAADKIPALELNPCVNVMETLCAERRAVADD